MNFLKTTEQDSHYDHLEKMSVDKILTTINKEDGGVAESVKQSIPQIELLVNEIVAKIKEGGRLFYIGAGTSGRLGILDASECPPTFGVPYDMVIGLIAGGDVAIRKAVEFAEDNENQGWEDLEAHNICNKDIVVGIAASGTTPYVTAAIIACTKRSIITGCITCNSGSPLVKVSDYPIEVVVGPEVVTGSSRMKAGTAQKLVLNMISTATMIKLGRVKGNKMVDMQLSNQKLIERGTVMIMEQLNVSELKASGLLIKYKNVRNVLKNYSNGNT